MLVGSLPVTVPSRETVGVPVPSTVLADQDVSINIKGGVLAQYDVKRGSEILGLVKLPGAVLSGLVAGVSQGLTDEKSKIDKRKDVADSEEALSKAIANRNTAALASRNSLATETTESGVKLENIAAGEAKPESYAAATLTVYPYIEDLARSIEDNFEKESEPARGNCGDLLDCSSDKTAQSNQ